MTLTQARGAKIEMNALFVMLMAKNVLSFKKSSPAPYPLCLPNTEPIPYHCNCARDPAATTYKIIRRGGAQQATTTNYNKHGTFYGYSAASPSYISKPSNNTKPQTFHAQIQTTNGTITAKHQYQTTLTLARGAKIEINALFILSMANNLLSIKYIITGTGPLVFTKDGSYVLPLKLLKVLHLRSKMATCKKGL